MERLIWLFWHWHSWGWLLRLCINIFVLSRSSTSSISYFLNNRLPNLWLIGPGSRLILHWRWLSLIKIYLPTLIRWRIRRLLITVGVWRTSSRANSVSIIRNRFVLVGPWSSTRWWIWLYILLIIQIATCWHFCGSYRWILVNLIWIWLVVYSGFWLSAIISWITIHTLKLIKLINAQIRFHKFLPLLLFLLP